MSEENLAAIRRAARAFREHDFDQAFELYHPDVVYYENSGTPLDTAEVLRGRDEMGTSLAAFIDEFPDFHSEIDELLDGGDKVVCVQRWVGTGRASGVPINLQEIIVFTFTQGKVIEARVYP